VWWWRRKEGKMKVYLCVTLGSSPGKVLGILLLQGIGWDLSCLSRLRVWLGVWVFTWSGRLRVSIARRLVLLKARQRKSWFRGGKRRGHDRWRVDIRRSRSGGAGTG